MALTRLRRVLTDLTNSPGLVVLTGLIGLLEVGTWLIVAPLLASASRPVLLGWVLLQRLLLVVALAALLPGCYAAARERLGPWTALRATAGRGKRHGSDLLASMLVSRVLASGLTVGAALVALTALGVVDTAAVWTEAYLGVGLDRSPLALVGVPAAIVGGSWLARGAVGLHDLRAIEADEPPARAPFWSLLAWRGRAWTLLGYAVVRGALLALPVVAAVTALTFASPSPTLPSAFPSTGTVALAAVAFVVVTAVARATLVAYQLSTYDHVAAGEETSHAADPTPATDPAATANPASATDPISARRRRRLLLAGILVLGTMVGLGAIRTLDVHPAPAERVDVTPEDAAATIETAIDRTRARDIISEQRTQVWNESSEEWDLAIRREGVLQRSDRSARMYVSGGPASDVGRRAMYSTDGRLAMLHDPTPPAEPWPWSYTVERNTWTVLVGQAYGWGVEDRFGYPSADAGWRLEETTDQTLVYQLVDPSSLGDPGGEALADVPEGISLADATEARIVLDRRLLTVRRASVTVAPGQGDGEASRRGGFHWERRTIRVGDVSAGRPGGAGPPSLPARLWDVVYY